MELGSALPAELLTACPPAGAAAPGLQRRPAADTATDPASPAGFDLLLQMLLGQPPAGQPLPAPGKELPPSSAIPAAAPALTATLTASSSATAEPAGAGPAPPASGAPPVDDPAAALRAALASASPSSGKPIESAALPAAPPQPASAASVSAPPMPAPLVADLQPADAPRDGAALDPPQAPPTSPATTPAAADPSHAAVADLAALEPSVANADPSVARPPTRAANVLTAQRSTATPATAGDNAAAAPAAVDEAAPLQPPAPVASAQAPELRVVRHDDPVPLVLQSADGAESSGAPLVHAAAHAAGPSVPASSSSAAAAPAQAAPQTPVDTTGARWHEALASRVHWLVDHGVDEARIRLNPPELGALDVKISLQDDKTFVQVTAHTAAARDELTQSLPRLRELLSAGGLALGGATVSGGRDDRGGRYAAAEPRRAAGFASGIEPVFAPRAASSAARGLVDLFA